MEISRDEQQQPEGESDLDHKAEQVQNLFNCRCFIAVRLALSFDRESMHII